MKQLVLYRREVNGQPAAFGRLCVETLSDTVSQVLTAPAAFGRLCVETVSKSSCVFSTSASRLRAAVC